MKHYRSKPICPPTLHDTVQALIVAAESGNDIEVKRLLNSSNFPEGTKNAATQALGNMDPMEHPYLKNYWSNWLPDSEPATTEEQQCMTRAYQHISKCIHLLLDSGADPNAANHDGVTALNKFDTEELTEIFNRLLQLGANTNSNYYGGNPLCNAAFNKDGLRVQLLLDQGADPNHVDLDGNTPLIQAAHFGSLETVQKLIIAGANVDHQNNDGDSPIMATRSAEILRKLITMGADVNHYNNNGETPLMRASTRQSLSEMQILIDAGADINCRDNMGRTALMNTLREHGETPILVLRDWLRDCHNRRFPKERSFNATSLLISSGAEIDRADNNGFYATDYALMAHFNGVELPEELKPNPVYARLCQAAIDNSFSTLNLLLVSDCIPQQIMTLALHLAATRGYVLSCTILLERGADVNGLDLFGNHPIESAAVGLHIQAVQLIIKHGAKAEGLNRALLSTCSSQAHYWPDEDKISFRDRRLELARHFLHHGANPNYRDDESDLPLKQAVAAEDCKLALLLLEYGADPTETDEDGGTLLEFARTDSMIEILHEWISKPCHPK